MPWSELEDAEGKTLLMSNTPCPRVRALTEAAGEMLELLGEARALVSEDVERDLDYGDGLLLRRSLEGRIAALLARIEARAKGSE